MIDNTTKVKALIKNLARGDSGKAQLLQRRYAMERFLERVAKSDHKHNLALKGGMLVTSMLDFGQRMTRDADATMLSDKGECGQKVGPFRSGQESACTRI